MGYLDDSFSQEDQLSNLWEMKILNGQNKEKITFKVQDVKLPFLKLEAKRSFSGLIYWDTFIDVESVQMTIRESSDFSTFQFFQNWMDKIFDSKKRVFLVQEKENYRNYDFSITFYNPGDLKSALKSLPSTYLSNIPGVNSKPNEKPKIEFTMLNCRIIGLDDLTLDYEGGPLNYGVTILPEQISFKIY
jgi:hypothetical protein